MTLNFAEVTDIHAIGTANTILLDCRATCHFNGWPEEGFKRGGHIPGAVDCSYCWLDCDLRQFTKHSLVDILMDKGLEDYDCIIAYSSDMQQARKVAEFLSLQGMSCIKLYNCSSYFQDEQKVLQSYTNYRSLLSVSALLSLLSGIDYDSISSHNLKYFEVSYGDESVEYLNQGHIPGSVHIDTNEIEYAPLWKLREDTELFQFLVYNGIRAEDRIVLSGFNMMACCRLAMILKYLGLKDVYVLDGGTAAYVKANGQLEYSSHNKTPCSIEEVSRTIVPGIIDRMEDVESFVRDGSGSKVLLDVRTLDEYKGSTTGYSDLRYKGNVRGSVFHGGCRSSNCQTVFDYINPDGTMRNFQEVLRMWRTKATTNTGNCSDGDGDGNGEWSQVTVDPLTTRVSLMCGSGWRTAQILFYCHVAGLTGRVSMYSNGWYEWSSVHFNDADKTFRHTARTADAAEGLIDAE